MNNKLRLRVGYADFVFLLLLVFICRNSMASIYSIDSENVQIRGDHISVQANGIKLGELLKEIKNSTGIEFELRGSLMNKQISVSFKELSLLKGIKKIIYPLNYAIVYDSGEMISKVIIIDQSNTSTMTAYNEGIDEFSTNRDLLAFEGAQMKGGGSIHIPSGSEHTLMESSFGTNMFVQTKADQETVLNEGLPGTDVPVQTPPDSEIALIEGPPGTDTFVQKPPAPAIAIGEDPPGTDLFMAQEWINPPPGE
jgi:hypothetical protein